MEAILTVDVEDWFHILNLSSTPPIDVWDSLPSRVEANFRKLMDIFSETGTRGTCFFLGWVGKTHPHLVKEAAARGHEIASHGYAHKLVYQMSPDEFRRDILDSKHLLEDLAGDKVRGYRAPGFSVTQRTPWFFAELAAAGFVYDASVFPGAREHGGLRNGRYHPYRVVTDEGELVELPVTLAKLLGTRICLFGGGYLRLAPLPLIERKTKEVLREGSPVICYVHPREVDPDQPRLAMSLRRRFKTYVNLRTTEGKLSRLVSAFEFTSAHRFLSNAQVHTWPTLEFAAAVPSRRALARS